MLEWGLPFFAEVSIKVAVLLFSIIIHEMAHGYVALKNGDPTARMMGRITLNPLPHLDLVGSIILPLLLIATSSPVLFGWAKPVPVNPYNFRNPRLGEITVSAAGPLSNLILAVLFAYLLRFAGGNPGLLLLAKFGVVINIFLALFNLVPIPPLDGSHLLASILPPGAARVFHQLEPFGFILILFLLYTGLLQVLIMPIFKVIYLFLMPPGFY